MKRFIQVATLLVCQNDVFAQPPPELFKCDPDSFQCVMCKPGQTAGCNFQKPCELSCGKFTPEDMLGTWRGFEVKNGASGKFDMGEVDAVFNETSLLLKRGDGSKTVYAVSTTQGDTFVLSNADDDKPIAVVNSLIGNLKYTTAMGLSSYGNETFPDSFGLGIKANNSMNFALFQCNRWGSNDTCSFNLTEAFAETYQQPMLGMIGDDKCARCDESEEKCMPCKCGTGADCVPADDCTAKCKPTGPRFSCQWNTTVPKCVEDPKGHLNKTQCGSECHEAAYGKCDFEQNDCVPCTPGADDRECVYLMSYCAAAQKEGRCKEEVLSGLWRMVESNNGFDHGEFDIEFRGGKMFIQDYTNMTEAVEVGDVKKTGNADYGAVIFEVENWKSDPKIWPHDKMYGIFQQSYGEQQIFNFLEMAFSEAPIKDLKDGLTGRYFIGLDCMDKKVCDFSKAAPKPPAMRHQPFTPVEQFFLQ